LLAGHGRQVLLIDVIASLAQAVLYGSDTCNLRENAEGHETWQAKLEWVGEAIKILSFPLMT